MRQAALIAEHYGLASRTYALTCEKWEEVDSQWRTNFENVRAEAGDCESVLSAGTMQSPDLRPLPETQAILQMPSLNVEKFPAVDAVDFVGPMVRFEALQASPPHLSHYQHQHQQGHHEEGVGKRAGLLRLFTDPASLLRKS